MLRMKQLAVVALLVAVVAAQTGDPNFNYFPCYDVDYENQMPVTLDNLVALLEKYELQNSYTNIDAEAEMLVNRYRKDGMVYRPNDMSPNDWVLGELDKETEKQTLVEDVIRPSESVPIGTYDVREECGLHMLLSHSTDTYPREESNDLWDGTINRNNRGDRNKRSVWGSSSSSSGASKSSSSSSSSSASKASSSSTGRILDNFEPTEHPMEMGVMETPYGPVAAGTLLSGLMSLDTSRSATVGTLLNNPDLPPPMPSKTINGLYAATLSGDLAQVSLMLAKSMTQNAVYMGPSGRYYDCTTCSKFFSLENNKYSLLSRAELFAGLDALILKQAYSQNSGSYSSSMKLSQMLRLYYSEKGLPNLPNVKACNRLRLFSQLDQKEIYDQALNFMYAFQNDFPTIKNVVALQSDFSVIEQKFKEYLDKPFNAMKSFISSYNYDDEGYSQCYLGSSGSGGFGGSTSRGPLPPSEGMADLIAVYGSQGSVDVARDQRQMIADVARRLGVSYTRSRLGVMSGRNGQWLLEPTNLTNVADWGCNFTSNQNYGSGGVASDSFQQVLTALSSYYENLYESALEDLDTSSGRSQVVLWQVPSSMSGDREDNLNSLHQFRNDYPDVRFIFVGQNKSPYQDYIQFDDDFIPTSGQTLPDVTTAALGEVLTSARFFVYPACDPEKSSEAASYREESHTYDGAVTPNFTTYIRIAPSNFHYSEEFAVRVSGNVRTCFSRTNRFALEDFEEQTLEEFLDIQPDSDDDTITCIGGPSDTEKESVTIQWPCNRNLTQCNPVYMSVTGLSTGYSSSSCVSGGSDNTVCEYPHQIKYSINHKGMICGASAAAPALLLLALAFVHRFVR